MLKLNIENIETAIEAIQKEVNKFDQQKRKEILRQANQPLLSKVQSNFQAKFKNRTGKTFKSIKFGEIKGYKDVSFAKVYSDYFVARLLENGYKVKALTQNGTKGTKFINGGHFFKSAYLETEQAVIRLMEDGIKRLFK